jgi:hypothetical protein
MADDDRLADPSSLTRALPVPATTLATLDADTLAPAELAARAPLRRRRQGSQHASRLRR